MYPCFMMCKSGLGFYVHGLLLMRVMSRPSIDDGPVSIKLPDSAIGRGGRLYSFSTKYDTGGGETIAPLLHMIPGGGDYIYCSFSTTCTSMIPSYYCTVHTVCNKMVCTDQQHKLCK